jgi:hypothetical protein
MADRLLLAVAFSLAAGSEAQAQFEHIWLINHQPEAFEIRERVTRALERIPQSVKDRVFSSGCRIVIVPMIDQYLGKTFSDIPQGYRSGGGYDNTDGTFRCAENEIVIAETVSYRNGSPKKVKRVNHVLCHEFGHAYDQSLIKDMAPDHSFASSLPQFLETHEKEVTRMTNSKRSELEYYCQDGSAGAGETFAELFCLHCEPQSDWGKQQQDLVAAFPQTDALVKAAMESPSVCEKWRETL